MEKCTTLVVLSKEREVGLLRIDEKVRAIFTDQIAIANDY